MIKVDIKQWVIDKIAVYYYTDNRFVCWALYKTGYGVGSQHKNGDWKWVIIKY